MDTRTIERRSQNDPEFSQAVSLIESLMHKSTLTPLDIRDACYLARVKFEYNNVRPIVMQSNQLSPDFLDKLRKNNKNESPAF